LVAAELLLATGIRVGELTSLTTASLDLAEATIRVHGKGARERQVHILDDSVQALLVRYLTLREGRTKGTALLITPQGHPASAQLIRRLLSEGASAAGLSRRVTPHMLRHSCATFLLEAGVDIRFVQRLLGHGSISTTERYTHVSSGSLRAALLRGDVRAKVLGEAHSDN
jgi:integrase/recombinase XerD